MLMDISFFFINDFHHELFTNQLSVGFISDLFQSMRKKNVLTSLYKVIQIQVWVMMALKVYEFCKSDLLLPGGRYL